ncbi:integrin beta-PS-like [Pieris napi]|nr:integrin beta-PS-like [Pieris napi]
MNTHFSLVFMTLLIVSINSYKIASLDESWICRIKKTCVDCLQLGQCSWCPSKSVCFSESTNTAEQFCNETVRTHNYEMSLYENARCACEDMEMENNCRPEGMTEGPECHARGKCVCGKCFCNANPDPENPSKVIIGDHCEYDNFSCDGPKCNEGPYSINELHIYAEENAEVSEVEQPLEE